MKPIVVVAVLAAMVAAFFFLRSRVVPTRSGTSAQIPALVAALTTSGKDASFFVFMFVPPGAAQGDVVNLQYSVYGGKVGFDWVLRAPRNITDKDKIAEFVRASGYSAAEKEMNGVRFLRVEGKGVEDLGGKIINEFYKIPVQAPLDLITQDFAWNG